jgi:hypothetical protein
VVLVPDPYHHLVRDPTQEVYQLDVDLVSASWVSGIASIIHSARSSNWSSTCGATQRKLTSQVLPPPSPGQGLVTTLLSQGGVVAAQPDQACTFGWVGKPCSGPQVFAKSFTVFGNTTTDSFL